MEKAGPRSFLVATRLNFLKNKNLCHPYPHSLSRPYPHSIPAHEGRSRRRCLSGAGCGACAGDSHSLSRDAQSFLDKSLGNRPSLPKPFAEAKGVVFMGRLAKGKAMGLPVAAGNGAGGPRRLTCHGTLMRRERPGARPSRRPVSEERSHEARRGRRKVPRWSVARRGLVATSPWVS